MQNADGTGYTSDGELEEGEHPFLDTFYAWCAYVRNRSPRYCFFSGQYNPSLGSCGGAQHFIGYQDPEDDIDKASAHRITYT